MEDWSTLTCRLHSFQTGLDKPDDIKKVEEVIELILSRMENEPRETKNKLSELYIEFGK